MAVSRTASGKVLALSEHWQLLFAVVAIGGWLSGVIATASLFLSDYTSAGTWTFNITVWLLPVLYFIAAFVLLGIYPLWLKRIFMSCVAATIGMGTYSIVATWWWHLRSIYLPVAAARADDKSWWTAFGADWTIMAAGLVVYVGLLWVLTRHPRR